MADFVNPPVELEKPAEVDEKKIVEVESKNICIVSITNGHAYDSSQLKSNADLYYVEINYKQLKDLYYVIKNNQRTNNMVYKTVDEYVKGKKAKVFFEFKCSGDCHNGENFVDDATTLLVFKVVNVMTRLGCNIVVGDHSMASLFNRWDGYRMDCKSPIQVSGETTNGPYKMRSTKSVLQRSDYPLLKNLGDMSGEENVEIEFENMSGTKIYSIKESSGVAVEIISRGKSKMRREEDMNEIVHSEFVYRNGKIIISATHWCNLTEVNSEMDIGEVRRQCVLSCGIKEAEAFDEELEVAVKSGIKEEVKKVVSKSVKYMFSGQKD